MFFEEHDACGIGFLADLGGPPSHDVVRLALEAVACMKHRGARSADGRTGDGAGILCETPRRFFARELSAHGLHAAAAHLAAICLFLPPDPETAAAARAIVEGPLRQLDITPLRWRQAPTDERVLGQQARSTRLTYEQLLVDLGPGNVRERMRMARHAVQRALAEAQIGATVISASENSVVYKALLSSDELANYFPDLRDPLFASRFAVFHQRFSTNTAPSWRFVQPFGHIAHNGEINTITGNRAWMRARGHRPTPGASDSYDLNSAIDAMLGAGYTIDVAVDLLLAPAIEPGDERLKAYYDAHLPTVEPWDGPAAIVYADGAQVGAALDRAGLRPLRWARTESGKVLVASEAGIADFGNDPIVARGRLGPGGRLVARLASGELVQTEDWRNERRERANFGAVVQSWSLPLDDAPSEPPGDELARDLRRFGVTREELKDVVAVLASGGGEPVLSMGDDAAPAFFERGTPVASYLRQRFAQVTNPPIDPLREALVFDLRAFVGSGDINGDVPAPRSIVSLDSGILSESDFDRLRFDDRLYQRSLSLELGAVSLAGRVRALAHEAAAAVRGGATLIVLDDREDAASVPAILACGAIHQELTRAGLRMAASIAVADGYARDAHAVAAAMAAGANVVSPWLGLRAAEKHGTSKLYLAGLRAGLLKILAKLGICTLRSYVGAQTFESLGLAREVVELCFPGMRAHVPAVGFVDLESDVRHWFDASREPKGDLPDRGSYRYRREGVRRAFDPQAIKTLRASAMQGDFAAFEALSDAMEAREPVTLRDLLAPVPRGERLELDAVEPVDAITANFATAAMSLGSLGPEVHATIARAANTVGARSNSGEGGEDRARFSRSPNSARSRIKQVASARFGVGAEYLASADEVEIKIAQGSKPGEGGQIPGHKVTAEIAALRGAAAGQSLISPPPHHDIYSIEDLAELIYDLRRAAPHARIAVKLVSQSGIGIVASGVAKADADVIHISGHDGGTGASPLSSIIHAGLPWEIGLVEAHHALLANGLRSRVALRVDGGFKNGRDVVLATLLGADEYGFGSALLVALGCIYARQCHKNTCPVGIATQDLALRAKFAGTTEEAVVFLEFVARDVRRRLAALGAHSLAEIRGRSDLLRRRELGDVRLANVDLSEILRLPESASTPRPEIAEPPHLDDAVARPWFESGIQPELRISPVDRAVGARLAYDLVHHANVSGERAKIAVRYAGTAGQSFGAFTTHGLELTIVGDANDYVGKSMEGGRIVVRGWNDLQEPMIGNAAFYGARGGEGFIRGAAGERFAVRNSGATLVVEGAGDHCCEYMTAGTVVILGPAGKNFASGMSGGTVYVRAGVDDLRAKMGPTECRLEACVESGDADVLRALLVRHSELTGSAAARRLLDDWPAALASFVRLTLNVASVHPAEPAATALSK